ncbi:histidine kinase [Tissierella creatinini]|nr:histidine kinase [Tissierella creatinini]TJX60665.1 histidine kinase [Soehngenia saccharolytica]
MNKDIVLLNIPNKSDYIGLVRLASSSISNKSGLNIDEIEDIKVAIGEACANAFNLSSRDSINIEFIIEDDKLTIRVSNAKEIISEDLENAKDRQLGILIIKSLMDEVVFNDYGIQMTKYIE